MGLRPAIVSILLRKSLINSLVESFLLLSADCEVLMVHVVDEEDGWNFKNGV
jgi:hypothetical protein